MHYSPKEAIFVLIKTYSEMKKLIPLFLLLFSLHTLLGQEFETHFADTTLRLNYTFAGNADQQLIALEGMQRQSGWYGRRHHLSSVPLRGNGDITLYHPTSGEILYKSSFSSLFQEWIVTPESSTLTRSFEASFLVPMPLQEVDIEVVLRGNEGQLQASLRHRVDPNDPLIAEPTTTTPHLYVHRGGDPREAIDVAILAEGYTLEQMDLFLEDARTTAEEILRYAPFSNYRSKFNFVAVMSASRDGEVSVPHEGKWASTAIGSHFTTFYMERYLTTNQVHTLYDLVEGIPCEHLIILANTDTYGGGGIYNSYTLTTAHHPPFKPVVVHEFGHSFGGLGDEYFYETADRMDETHQLSHEPWEPNITTLVDFGSKWADMLPSPGIIVPTEPTAAREASYEVGLYEGGGYRTKGVFRPAVVCRMRDNTATRFCPVCERAIERVIQHHLGE